VAYAGDSSGDFTEPADANGGRTQRRLGWRRIIRTSADLDTAKLGVVNVLFASGTPASMTSVNFDDPLTIPIDGKNTTSR